MEPTFEKSAASLVESTVNTVGTPEALVLEQPEQPIAAICDQFFAHGGVAGTRELPALLTGQLPMTVGELLEVRSPDI